MQKMLTQWGFTTVWDLGSNPADLLPLRQRIRAGEVLGPNIFFAGSIFPKDGHPSYLPPEMQLPEAATPERATQLARTYMPGTASCSHPISDNGRGPTLSGALIPMLCQKHSQGIVRALDI